jgi:hypothetical protein
MDPRWWSRLAVGVLPALVWPIACRQPRLPLPPTGPHLAGLKKVDEVGYPSPPAQIEEVDVRAHRDDGCVWVDGSWRWNGRRWMWESGAWMRPPPGCYYAPGESFWQPSDDGPGVLYYRNPAWYPAHRTAGTTAGCAAPERCE